MARSRRDSGSGDSAEGDPRRELGYAKPGTTARRPSELGQWAKQTARGLCEADTPPTPAELAAERAWIREDLIERAAIFEYLGGVPRKQAEGLAKALVDGAHIRYVGVR